MIRRVDQEFVAVPKREGSVLYVKVHDISSTLIEMSAQQEDGQFFGYSAFHPSEPGFPRTLRVPVLRVSGAEDEDFCVHLPSAITRYYLIARERYQGPEATRLQGAFSFPLTGLTSHHLRRQ